MNMREAVERWATTRNAIPPRGIKICFKDSLGNVHRWLHYNGETVLFIHKEDRATEFTQEQVDVILLTLWNADNWHLGPATPCLVR